MSLYETGESNGKVSLTSLFENKALADEECISDLTIDGIIQAACRGGWPSIMNKKTYKAKLMISGSYFDSLCRDDISNVDNVKRDEQGTRLLLRSYARNISTFASNRTILRDINANYPMGETTFYDYLTIFAVFITTNIVFTALQIVAATTTSISPHIVFEEDSV